MASYKDCIHEEVCNYFEVDLNEYDAENCVCFKDCNRFVELPCDVEYRVDGKETYDKYKNRAGKTVNATIEKNSYDDGTVKYSVTALE